MRSARRHLSLLLVLPVMMSCSAAKVLTGGDAGGDSCSGPAPFVPGATVTGVTSRGSNNCISPDGSRTQLFTMILAQQTNIELQLTANGFPPYLALYTSSKQILAQTNTSIKAFLPAGTYTIVVSSTSGRDGTYSLTSVPAVQKGCPTGPVVTAIGATIDGAVTADNCAGDGGVGTPSLYFELWQVAAGTTVTLSVTVGARSGVYLQGPTGILAQKEMTAAGSFTMTATAPTTGGMQVRIESRRVNNVIALPVTYTITLK